MSSLKELLGTIFWFLFGKRNSDLPENEADSAVATAGALGHGCIYIAKEDDEEFWRKGNKVAIWRASVSTCILLEGTTKLIEAVDEDCVSLDDAKSALDYWLEQDEWE